MLSHKAFCGTRVLGSQLRKWDREKEGGRQENWGERNLGWLERMNRGHLFVLAISAICKSCEPLNFRAMEQNQDSRGIQEGKALCPDIREERGVE